MSQARPVSPEEEALNSSELCSTDFARCGSNLQDNHDHSLSSSLNSIPLSPSTFSESDVWFIPYSTPGPSSAASSEKIDAGTCDCLRPLLANVEDELVTSQMECYELQQQVSQLEEQLRQSEEEKQKLQADLGRYHFLEEKEKRHERLLGWAAPVQDPDHPSGQSMSVRRHGLVGHGANLPEFMPTQDNSMVLLPDRHDKELQMSNGTSLTSSRNFVLLQGDDRSDEIASRAVETDYDCSQYASIPSSESSDETSCDLPVLNINAESNSSSKVQSALNAEECPLLPNSSDDCNQYASISSSGSSDETSGDMPVLNINAESNSSSLQSTGNAKECTRLPNSSEDGFLSVSSNSTSSSDSLVNSTQTTQAVASKCTSQASSDSTDGSPMLTSVNSHSAFGSNEISSGSGLNPTSSEKEVLSSSQAGEESEHEDGEVTGACAAGSEERVKRSVDLRVRTQSGANVGNIPWSQQGAFSSAEMTVGTHSSGAFNGTATDWERQGARPKQGQVQHSVIEHMPGEPFIPVTDGLAGDFLARHTQDKALRDSLYQSVDAEMPLFNDIPSRGASYIDGVINVSAQRYTAEDDTSAIMPEQVTGQKAQNTNLALGNHSSSTANNESTWHFPVLCSVSNSDPTGARLGSTASWPSLDPTDNSLLALEQRVAEACALVERVLREREEREQFGREIERKEQLIREQRARERREREEREIQEAERWPQQQEAITARSQWLCEHYQRHCRVRFPCCTQYYPCHPCHNISKACDNEEAKVCHASHLKCSHCQHEQETGEDSEKCRMCGSKMSAYFCSICQHFISTDNNPYHCEKCVICRIHKDKSFHCEVCNVCLDKRLQGNHKCRPDSGHDECCFCLEDAFSGCQILPCSHKAHRECTIAMIQYGIRTCPICQQPLRTVGTLD